MDLGRIGGTAGGEVSRGEVVAFNKRVGVVRAALRLAEMEVLLAELDRVVDAAGDPVGSDEGRTGVG